MRFDYSGVLNGTFSVRGEIGQNTLTPSGARAWKSGEYYIGLRGQDVVTSSRIDVLDIRLLWVRQTGRIEFCDLVAPDPPCVLPGSFRLSGRESSRLTSATVTITTLSADRIRGTFDGVTTSDGTLISNGAFDLPLEQLP